MTFHPSDRPPTPPPALGETLTVWGARAHADLSRTRLGIVGLGSVGSLGAEAASRMGMARLTYIDHDVLEIRNLDRTHGATVADVVAGLTKVAVAGRATTLSHTAPEVDLRLVARSLLFRGWLPGRARLRRPAVVRRSTAATLGDERDRVRAPDPRRRRRDLRAGDARGTPLHVDWQIHAVGPGRACLVCVGALRRSDVSLDRDGKLDDPEYIAGLSDLERAAISRRNVFPFSMSVAAHQVLQAIGIATAQPRIGGAGPQMYHAYPGIMDVDRSTTCEPDCEFPRLTAGAPDLRSNWS